MKTSYITGSAYIFSVMVIVFGGCQVDERDKLSPEMASSKIASDHHEIPTLATENHEDTISELEQAPVAPPIAPEVSPISNPVAFIRNAFDDNSHVPPWKANYIGSYGLLPTRFQDKGPYLYSFDISEDADIFNDDDFAPRHSRGSRHDDDDKGSRHDDDDDKGSHHDHHDDDR